MSNKKKSQKKEKTKPQPDERLDPLCATFANNLRRMRQKLELKLSAAAYMLGVSDTTWSRWENGQRFPTGPMLAAIAKTLMIEPCKLLKTENAPCDKGEKNDRE